MPAPKSAAEFWDVLARSRLLTDEQSAECVAFRSNANTDFPGQIRWLQSQGWLTPFQIKLLLTGRHKGFFLGGYRILDLLARGGSSTVYLARSIEGGPNVALKVSLEADSSRLEHEAEVLQSIHHPNLVGYHGSGVEKGARYLALEWVAGQTLRQMVEEQGPLPVNIAANIASQAASGLQALLDHGWIHCDVKPENLILSDQGTVTLIDLELAQQVGRGQAILMGTPEYSAPEQALGDANLDHRADIYSLGATLFLLLTGQPPYSGLPSAILLQHQLGTPPDPRSLRSDLPPRLAEVVQKMMAKRPEDRYRAWTDVKFALRPWLVSIRKY